MADIEIRKTFTMPIGKARKAAQAVADELAKQYNIAYEWEGDVLTFQKTGLKGELRLAPKKIEIDVSLGFVMRMFKDPMRSEIEKNIDKIFS
jgi:putative polyhydroxyalkanoate system protein